MMFYESEGNAPARVDDPSSDPSRQLCTAYRRIVRSLVTPETLVVEPVVLAAPLMAGVQPMRMLHYGFDRDSDEVADELFTAMGECLGRDLPDETIIVTIPREMVGLTKDQATLVDMVITDLSAMLTEDFGVSDNGLEWAARPVMRLAVSCLLIRAREQEDVVNPTSYRTALAAEVMRMVEQRYPGRAGLEQFRKANPKLANVMLSIAESISQSPLDLSLPLDGPRLSNAAEHHISTQLDAWRHKLRTDPSPTRR